MFRRLREANRDKCQFLQRSIRYLGPVISEAGIFTDPDKVSVLRELIPPTNFVPSFGDVVVDDKTRERIQSLEEFTH